MLRRLALLAVLVAGLWIPSLAAAPAPNTSEATNINWLKDPTCQMVFFAVLEGLYTDGVSTEDVDRILGVDPKTKQARMEEHFVYTCPLCQPAYEAFRLYRSRQRFDGLKAEVDTFGSGLEPKLAKKLQSSKRAERLEAIQTLVDTWVRKRLNSLNLTKDQRADITHKLEVRRNQGMAALKFMQAGGKYDDMKLCPICEGAFCASK